jgi:hypothetical protein
MYNPYENRNKITFYLIIRLLSPLSHIGEAIGNQSNLRIEKIRDLENNSAEVFVYSGNALRGKILRRIGNSSFLNKLKEDGCSVNPTTHQTMFAGGFIDGSTGNDLELDKKIRTYLPGMSLLGAAKPTGLFGSKDSQMIPGRINVGGAYLVCLETAEYIYNTLPAAIPYNCLEAVKEIVEAKNKLEKARIDNWLNNLDSVVSTEKYRNALEKWMPYLENDLKPYTQYLTYRQQTRQDSLKSPELAKHLEQKVEGQMSLFGTTNKDKKKDKKEAKSQQMIMGDWLLQKGSTLLSRWDADITSVEEGFVVNALSEFALAPYLGGKGNSGCGLVSVDVYYRSGQNAGQYLTITENSSTLSDRAKTKLADLSDFLNTTKTNTFNFLE